MSLRILQLTDCHLPVEAGTLFRGRDADQCLGRLVSTLAQLPSFDHILLTGDLVHHGGPDAYSRLLSIIEPLSGERHWLPGNHDDNAAMQRADAGGGLGRKQVNMGNWALLQLDTTSEPDGRGGGSLAMAELDWLQQTLAELRARPVLLALHHNPAPTGSRWQDEVRLANSLDFEALVTAAPQVKGIVCGHLHQSQVLTFAGRPLWSAPSTVIQFGAGCDTFTLETDPRLSTPGCRWYELHADGRIDAHLLQLSTHTEEEICHG